MRRRERELKVVNGHPAAVGFLKGPSGGAGHPGAGGGGMCLCVSCLPPPLPRGRWTRLLGAVLRLRRLPSAAQARRPPGRRNPGLLGPFLPLGFPS